MGACSPMRPPPEAEIYAPEFPRGLEWLNVAFLRMNTLMGRGAVLVEFWDFARVNSLRTLPYLKAWHERYAEAGLRVIGVHTPGLLVRPRPRHRGARGRAARDPVTRWCSTPTSRSGASTGTRAGRAATCSTAPAGWRFIHYGEGEYVETELRDPGVPRRSDVEPHGAAAPRGRARRRCSSRRPPTSRCPPTATGSSWCATGPTARTGSRRPTPARRRSFSFSAGAAYAVLSGAAIEPGLYETDGTVDGRVARPAPARRAVHARAASACPDLLGQHEADVLLDDLELRRRRWCRARGRSRPAAERAPRARSRRSVMPTTRLPSSHSSRTCVSLSIRCESAPWSRATSTSRFEFDELREPITSTRSHSRAIWRTAIWRLVVA